MISISIGDIQKNTSLLSKITETIEVVDKRKKKTVAVIYPVGQSNVVSSLAGKYKNRVSKIDDLDSIKEEAMYKAMEEKYGKSN